MGKHNEMTRYGFISHMEDYIKKLLTNPLKADTDDFLKYHGIDGPKAIEILTKKIDQNDDESYIVKKTVSIKDNGYDENGKRNKDTFTIKYLLPRKDYTKKMRNLYISLFESNIVEGNNLNEYDGGGATSSDSSGQYTTPLFGKPIKRKLYLTKEQLSKIKDIIKEDDAQGTAPMNSAGDYMFDVPMGGKAKKDSSNDFYKEANDHKDIIKKSWQEMNEEIGNELVNHINDFGKKVKDSDFRLARKIVNMITNESVDMDTIASLINQKEVFAYYNGYKDAQNIDGINLDEEIKIKEKNKGKFTKTKRETGKSTEELTHSKNPITRKRAIFAQNAKKWNDKK